MNIQSQLFLVTLTIFTSITLIGCGNNPEPKYNSEYNNDHSRSKQGWNNQGNWIGKHGIFDLRPENRVQFSIQTGGTPNTVTLELRYKIVDVVLSEETKYRLQYQPVTEDEQYFIIVLTPSKRNNNIFIAQEHAVNIDTATIIAQKRNQAILTGYPFGPPLTNAIEIDVRYGNTQESKDDNEAL